MTEDDNRKARRMLATYLLLLLVVLGFDMGLLVGINLAIHHWLGL